MSQLIPGPGQELVRALIKVEHDRVMRVPGTDTECFPLDVHVAESFEKLGVVARGAAVARSDLAGSASELPEASTGLTLLVEHGLPLFDPTSTLAALTEAEERLAERDAQLTFAEGGLAEARAVLEQRDAELLAARERLAELETADAAPAAPATDSAQEGADAAKKVTTPAAKKAAKGSK